MNRDFFYAVKYSFTFFGSPFLLTLTAVAYCVGALVTTYRRGFRNGVWDRVWHWIEQCEEFPKGTCVMRRDRPPEESLCVRCKSFGRSGRPGE
jgi:hypothetical protein